MYERRQVHDPGYKFMQVERWRKVIFHISTEDYEFSHFRSN